MCPSNWRLVRECVDMDEVTLGRIAAVKALAEAQREEFDLQYERLLDQKQCDSIEIEKKLHDIAMSAGVPFLDVCYKADVDATRFILYRMTEPTERIATILEIMTDRIDQTGQSSRPADLSAIHRVGDLDR